VIGRRVKKDPWLLQVEQDFTALTLTVHWIEFLDTFKGSRLGPKKTSWPFTPFNVEETGHFS
jgi:hypothetical protein